MWSCPKCRGDIANMHVKEMSEKFVVITCMRCGNAWFAWIIDKTKYACMQRDDM